MTVGSMTVVNLVVKQFADERVFKKSDDNVANALATATVPEQEKVSLAKTTPDFSEQLMFTFIVQFEEKDDHLVLNQYLNNVFVKTRFFDCI
jgi:hypothetical protein